MVHDTGEHAGPAAAQRGRVHAGPLEGLPGQLQQQPLLRVHGERLARGDAEERGVEPVGVVQEAAFPGVAGARVSRLGMVEPVDVPAAVGGELGDAVTAAEDQLPQGFRVLDSAGVAAAHGDDRDGVAVGGRGCGRMCGHPGGPAGELAEQVVGERGRVGVAEDQGGRQPQAGGRADPVAQLHREQRVEAQVGERLPGVDGAGRGVPEHVGDLRADQLADRPGLVLFGQSGERHRPGGGVGRAAPGRPDEAAQQGRHRAAAGEGGEVGGHRQDVRAAGGECPVEQGRPGGGRQRAAEACPLVVAQVRRHARVRPQAPAEGGGGQAVGAAVRGEPVQDGVGGGVVGLARGAEARGRRGEQREHGQRQVPGQLVQGERGVRLGAQDGVQPLGGEVLDDAVVEHAGGVHDAGERVFGRDGVEHRGQRVAVGGVAGGDRHLRVQVGGQRRGAGGVRAAPAEQHEVPDPVPGHQVPGDERAERAGAAGDQDGAVHGPRGVRRLGRVVRGAGQPRGEEPAVADREVGFVGVGEQQRAVAVSVAVDEHDAAGVLGPGGAHQAGDRGGREVGDVLVGVDGDRTAGAHDEPAGRGGVGEPGLHGVQRRVGAAADLAGVGRRRGPQVRHGHVVAGRHRGQLDPVHGEQGASGTLDLVGQRAQGERGDLDHGQAGAVAGEQRVLVRADPGEPGAQRRGTGGVEGDAGPREGQPCGGVAGHRGDGVQDGVEQRGVDAEQLGPGAGRLGQRHLGVQGVAGAPGRGEALEGGAVVEAAGGEVGVAAGAVDGLGLRGRPFGEAGGGRRVPVGQRAGGVPGPRLVGAVGPGVDLDVPVAAHPHLDADVLGSGQGERGGQGQLVDAGVAGAQGEVDERGAGQQDGAGDPVVGEPGLGGEGERAGEQRAVAAGERNGVAEQRLAPGGPVPLALEGVGGQLDGPGVPGGEHRGPVDGRAGDPGGAGGAQQGGDLVPVAAQHRDGVLDVGGQRGVGPQLDPGGHALVAQHLDRVGEPHGVADLPHPVGRIGDLTQHPDPRLVESERLGDGGELVEHRLHQPRMERMRHDQPLHPPALAAPGLLQRADLGFGAGHHQRGQAVDRRDVDALGHVVLGALHRQHRATRGQGLHQPAARGDEGAGVVQREDPGDVRGRQFADRVAQQVVGCDTPGLQQPEQRHLQREQRRLSTLGPVQQLLVIERHPLEPRRDLVQRRREHRERLVQLAAHPDPLRPLTGEQERRAALANLAPHHVRQQDGAVRQPGTGGRQR